MVATAAAIHFTGGVPVPVECGADHLIDPLAVDAAINSRTAAILPTQLNGRVADMATLTAIAERHHLAIVEDAAQSLGSRYRGRCAGTFGLAGAISFFPAKLLGCLGDGGALLINDDQIAQRAMALHDHGRDETGEVIDWGLNSRLDNLQAAILDFRLRNYGGVLEKRRALARAYQARLQSVGEVVLPPGPDADPERYDVYQNYEIEADRRDALRQHLKERGIGTLLPWGGKAVHQFDALGLRAHLPVTEQIMQRALLLPLHPGLGEDDVEQIALAIRAFFGSRS
jgi:dTDP-4-amino-4,6-dideoxygalactose transaminase